MAVSSTPGPAPSLVQALHAAGAISRRHWWVTLELCCHKPSELSLLISAIPLIMSEKRLPKT